MKNQTKKTSERIRNALRKLGFIKQDRPETLYNDLEEQTKTNFNKIFKEK